jgi:hypothetical protein
MDELSTNTDNDTNYLSKTQSSSLSSRNQVENYFSTHPTNETRSNHLEKHLQNVFTLFFFNLTLIQNNFFLN